MKSTRPLNSQWDNKRITSLKHKVRLQPQTRTMEDTCSVVCYLLGKNTRLLKTFPLLYKENQHVLQHQSTQWHKVSERLDRHELLSSTFIILFNKSINFLHFKLNMPVSFPFISTNISKQYNSNLYSQSTFSKAECKNRMCK